MKFKQAGIRRLDKVPSKNAFATFLMRIAILISVTAIAACATSSKEPTWPKPILAPAGWIQTFDYSSDLVAYLRGQYNSARLEGATAYAYLYTDSDGHCLATRRMMSRKALAPILEDVRITMLNGDRLKWIYDHGNESVLYRGKWAPVLAKIAANGTFEADMLLPDLPLYHEDTSDIHQYPKVTGRYDKDKSIQFVEELRRYFQLHNEI